MDTTTTHPSAVLVGGTIPDHVPGAYPSLSCCGGPVRLVDAGDPATAVQCGGYAGDTGASAPRCELLAGHAGPHRIVPAPCPMQHHEPVLIPAGEPNAGLCTFDLASPEHHHGPHLDGDIRLEFGTRAGAQEYLDSLPEDVRRYAVVSTWGTVDPFTEHHGIAVHRPAMSTYYLTTRGAFVREDQCRAAEPARVLPGNWLPSEVAMVEAAVRRVDPKAKILNLRTDVDGGGVVLVHLFDAVQPYVTWNWATKRTDGSPVGGATGAMLYRGNYFDRQVEAEGDFDRRHNR
jgi:hypothetical protein